MFAALFFSPFQFREMPKSSSIIQNRNKSLEARIYLVDYYLLFIYYVKNLFNNPSERCIISGSYNYSRLQPHN